MIDAYDVVEQLNEKGIAVLEKFVPETILSQMQQSYEKSLRHPQFNTWQGYQQNERWRLLIENLITLSPAFMFPIKNDALMKVCRLYIGEAFQVTEARGWKTIRTERNFHGWHNDAWYDITQCESPPPQLKLGIYLSDVESGEFAYVEQSHHQKLLPGHWNQTQVDSMNLPIKHVTGKAGTAFLFDTSGIHRQNYPVLVSRNVAFFNFHDPSFPIQSLDKSYDRYAPLLLNAAFLGNLTKEQERILGFGDKRYFEEAFIPNQRYPILHKMVQLSLTSRLLVQDFEQLIRRVIAKI